MTYYLAYTPSMGNSLIALSEVAIPEVEGVVVEIRDGDVPDLSRVAWNTATLAWYDKPCRRLTKLNYMNKFTDLELAAIYSAAKVSIQVEVWLAKFNASTPEPDGTSVDLDDPRTIEGLYSLEAAGLLTRGRADEILGY